ncbi:MAG: diaminopimelate epimerase [Pseudomonadota bacterium]
MKFVKMNAYGNDFMIIDMRDQDIHLDSNKIRDLADYKRSVGFDQLLTIEKSSKADIKTRIFNNDGKEAEACGNGSRCLAKLVFESYNNKNLKIETYNRILEAKLNDSMVELNMGKGKILKQDVEFDGCVGDLVDVGNPHIVIQNSKLQELGPIIENDARFPNRVNVNFVDVENMNLIALRTWERGVGATLSCGTGACASFYLLYRKGLVKKQVTVRQPGGEVSLFLDDEENIIMSGEALINYKGII